MIASCAASTSKSSGPGMPGMALQILGVTGVTLLNIPAAVTQRRVKNAVSTRSTINQVTPDLANGRIIAPPRHDRFVPGRTADLPAAHKGRPGAPDRHGCPRPPPGPDPSPQCV